jgi:AcrR family transcriptional regulator
LYNVAVKARGRGGAADPEGTRAALLEAGTQAFAERGFKGATADLIARRARANKAMINYHFGSKKGLYQAILTATFSEMAARFRGIRAADRQAPEQLRQFVALFADFAQAHPSFPVMFIREVLSSGEHMRREQFVALLGVFAQVREAIEQGIRDGSLRPLDPLITHFSLMGSLLFFFIVEPFRRRAFREAGVSVPAPEVPAFVAHMQELVTRGLAAPPPAPVRRKT